MARSSSGATRAELRVPAAVLRRLAARHPERYPVLLESAARGALGRYSVLLAEPEAALWADAQGRVHARGPVPSGRGFLDTLEAWWRAERTDEAGGTAAELPFTGGWAVFLGYELAAEVEPRLLLPASPLPWHAFALRTRCALVHDLFSDRVFAVAEGGCEEALGRLARDAAEAAASTAPEACVSAPGRVDEEDPEAFLRRVRRAKEHVRAGDIYQANLSRAWRVGVEGSGNLAAALHARLSAANPAPFAALAQWDGVALVSSSPERLIRIAGGRVDTRPIAGTRPRSRVPGSDAGEMSALAAHPKERAEHIMLIDLERNDLGRVCRAGSVTVDELMVIESYEHVHHIVSNVTGELRADATPIDALRAVFPGGTITGCPKVRCMEIIAALEDEGRGAYTGSLGYLGRDGRLDFNILIRTMTLEGGRLSFRAGAGIVADSEPQRELEETRAKARGLLAALGAAP